MPLRPFLHMPGPFWSVAGRTLPSAYPSAGSPEWMGQEGLSSTGTVTASQTAPPAGKESRRPRKSTLAGVWFWFYVKMCFSPHF